MRMVAMFLAGLFILSALSGCSPSQSERAAITLATTTSTRDSGLLDVLTPMFEEQAGIAVKVVAVGSGQALEMGRRGDADVLLTHAPEAEEQFVNEGFGVQRQRVMHNDFVLVGPSSDPAGVKAETSVAAAFRRIAEQQAPFISRGDESGTHMKERAIWQAAQVKPGGDWYVQAGAGMGPTLRMASEKQAYTLIDRGTFLAQRLGLDLEILGEGDELLDNVYSAILVSPLKHPHVQHRAAREFADFLLAPTTQQVIGEFGVDEYGQPLFFPVVKTERR